MEQEAKDSPQKAQRSLLPGVGSYSGEQLCLTPQEVVLVHQKFLSLN